MQKGEGISGVAALGAPWTPQSVFEHKKYTQSAPKMTSRVQKTPKCFKSDPQGRKMHSYRSAKVVQVHQKISAARYQARRTARSAFNKRSQLSLPIVPLWALPIGPGPVALALAL